MTNVDAGDAFLYPDAMVDYASAVTFELRENMAGNGHDGRTPAPSSHLLAELTFFSHQFASVSATAPTSLAPISTSPTTLSSAPPHSIPTSTSSFPSSRCADLLSFSPLLRLTSPSTLQPYLLPNTTTWCHACKNTVNSGCDVVALADNFEAQAKQLAGQSHFTPVGAGFIGFAVTLVLGLLVLASELSHLFSALELELTTSSPTVMRAFGFASFGKKSKPSRDERYPLGQAKGPDSVTSSHF